MSVAYVGLGSNLGASRETIARALAKLSSHHLISVRKCSPLYETSPVGGLPQPNYWNGVCAFQTELPPEAFHRELTLTETFMGRQRCADRYSPRTLDLDFLACDEYVIHRRDLILPHPRLHEREFVLKPFEEVNPDWVHPLLHLSIRQLLRQKQRIR